MSSKSETTTVAWFRRHNLITKAYPTAGALIVWQQREIERLRVENAELRLIAYGEEIKDGR